MKAYTDIEQSKKLTEILPIETIDMKYPYFGNGRYGTTPLFGTPIWFSAGKDIPCWSLVALLDVLDKTSYFINEDASVNLYSYKTIKWTICIDNCGLKLITEAEPVDACVEMILKLHELNLL